MAWLGRACALPGKALAVALAIWFLSGLRRGEKVGLKLTGEILKRFDVSDRWKKSRALTALREAGLIEVEQRPGKNPLVTIVEVKEAQAAA